MFKCLIPIEKKHGELQTVSPYKSNLVMPFKISKPLPAQLTNVKPTYLLVKVLMTESKGDYSNYAFVDHSLDNIPQI